MNRKIFIVSDTHFGHQNIITYHRSKYKDVAEMHEDMIKIWNEKIGKDDIVIHLGDVALGMEKEDLKQIFDQLNGIKMLLPGNHDRAILEKDRHYFNGVGFSNVEVGVTELVIGKWILTHEPMGVVPDGYTNIHGHCHGGITAALHGANSNKWNMCWDALPGKIWNATVLGDEHFMEMSIEFDRLEHWKKKEEEK